MARLSNTLKTDLDLAQEKYDQGLHGDCTHSINLITAHCLIEIMEATTEIAKRLINLVETPESLAKPPAKTTTKKAS